MSKALLNAATRLVAARCAGGGGGGGDDGGTSAPAVVAVCPGDVVTAMLNADAADCALSPEEAAEGVVWAAAYARPGSFTRNGQPIPW